MSIHEEVPDHCGNAVRVGSLVRVLDVPRLYGHAAPEDVEEVNALRGAVLEVHAIDARGLAWVAQWSSPDNVLQVRHTLGLQAQQMERVAPPPGSRPGDARSPGPSGALPLREPAAMAAAAAREARYEARAR